MNWAKERLSPFRFAGLSIIVGVCFGLLCAARYFLLEGPSQIATVWIANGVLTAFLLRQPKNRWWAFLLTAWLGNAVFILIVRDSLAIGASFAFCNTIEILIALFLLKGTTTP